MKLLLSSCFVLLFAFSANKASTNVFICDSSASKAYHSSKTCRGIQKCTHEILEVTLKDAKGTYGRVACKVCY
ncbi:MAG TPA: hypothetical protein VGC65_11245 [Bacteroidia bacterium]